jgi:hypothetical protein
MKKDTTSYSYININKERLEIEVEQADQLLVNQAKKDFDTSNKHIRNEEFFIWR